MNQENVRKILKIVMLGHKGAGKTIYLASLYKRLYIQRPEFGFSICAVDEKGQESPAVDAKLNEIYGEIVFEKFFPASTMHMIGSDLPP